MRLPLLNSSFWLSGYGRVFFVLAGTLVRAWFGWSHQLWNMAPDQSAWDLALADVAHHGLPAYRHLLHYPHEGGTLLLAALALLVGSMLGPVPPLSVAALLVDTGVRYLQIGWAQRLFGVRTALCFAAWTVLAVPLMLPWATVNFGLHALMSFAPFAVAVLLNGQAKPFHTGLVLGGLAVLAYDVWVLLPACVIVYVMDGKARAWPDMVSLFAGLVMTFLPHVVVRSTVDHGFNLEDWAPLSVRGMEQDGVDLLAWPGRFLAVWKDVLPASFTMGPVENGLVRGIAWGLLLVVACASVLSIRRSGRVARMAMVSVVSFMAAVAWLPLFEIRQNGHGIIYYRYFPFIAPFLVLLVIDGLGHIGSWWRVTACGWVIGCAVLSVGYMARTPVATEPNDEATGWVLARKYGDRPESLLRMASILPEDRRDDLLEGCGWGTAAALFDHRDARDTVSIQRAMDLLSRYPQNAQAEVWQGMVRAFDPGLTPQLDLRILEELRRRTGHE